MSSENKDGEMESREEAQLMSEAEMSRSLARLAQEIVERNNGTEGLALVGIRRRGVPLAQRLAKIIADLEKTQIPVGVLDINLYRDDFSSVATQPVIQRTEINFPIPEKTIVLVDDVLYTGRTIRAAMDALLDFGRPKAIQLCVLIDRGLRELPIEANYVGKHVQTSQHESVEVRLAETDRQECVVLTSGIK